MRTWITLPLSHSIIMFHFLNVLNVDTTIVYLIVEAVEESISDWAVINTINVDIKHLKNTNNQKKWLYILVNNVDCSL